MSNRVSSVMQISVHSRFFHKLNAFMHEN